MAYETGTATGIEDLISKLFTFATGLSTTPWTQDELDTSANYGTLHRDNCYVSFRWDATAETDLAIYQSLGWTVSTLPHNQDDDSGAGDTTIPIDSNRRVNFVSNGPFTKYYFFAGEGDEPYIHIVVEVDSGRFRHFGFGHLVKFGTWTGGEYAYAHVWIAGAASDDVKSTQHTFGMDGVSLTFTDGCTVHMEGVTDQGVNEKWGMCSSRSSPIGTDRAGEDRIALQGGTRSGFWGYYLSWVPYSTPNAYKPFMPIPLITRNTAAAPDTWLWLGEWPDVAIVNMTSFTPAQEITIGSDTWMVFPWVRKQYLQVNTEESWNAGIAYKKIV